MSDYDHGALLEAAIEKEAAAFWYTLTPEKATKAVDWVDEPEVVLAQVYALLGKFEGERDFEKRNAMRVITLADIKNVLEVAINDLLEKKALQQMDDEANEPSEPTDGEK
jgi:orotate phosphoribosyltransferase